MKNVDEISTGKAEMNLHLLISYLTLNQSRPIDRQQLLCAMQSLLEKPAAREVKISSNS